MLGSLKITHKQDLGFEIPKGTNTLAQLCDLGVRDTDISWIVFEAVWAELNGAGRPPVLYTLDGLSYIMKMSEYRDTENKAVHSHDLATVKHFVNLLSGKSTLANGGAIIAATSRSHNPISKSLDLAIAQRLDVQNEEEVTQREPFERKYDERVDQVLQNISVMNLGGLSKHEARGLMEYWAASGVLRQRVDEQSVTEKWALAGNGVVGEIQRGALRMRI